MIQIDGATNRILAYDQYLRMYLSRNIINLCLLTSVSRKDKYAGSDSESSGDDSPINLGKLCYQYDLIMQRKYFTLKIDEYTWGWSLFRRSLAKCWCGWYNSS